MQRYRLTFSDNWWDGPHQFVIRVMTRGEILVWQSLLDTPYDAEEYVLSRCVENGAELDDLPAGIVDSLLRAILALSGAITDHPLSRFQWVVEDTDRWLGTKEGRMEALAISFGGLDLERLWSMDIDTWMKQVTAAVHAAILHGIDPSVVNEYVQNGLESALKVASSKAASVQQQAANLAPVHMPIARNARLEKEWEFSWRKERR